MTDDEERIALALSKLPAKRNVPGKCYVVLILGTDEFDVTNPEIIGPFESYRQAYEWIARLPNACIAAADQRSPGHITLEPAPYSEKSGKGQFAGWAIVSDQTASEPQAYLANYDRIVLHPEKYPDLLDEYTMLFGEHTGLPCAVYVHANNGVVTSDPFAPRVSPLDAHAEAMQAWIELNRDALEAHWRGDIDGGEMAARVRKLTPAD
jgi:hypothetical protein